jgi:hypothetical protein
MEKSPAQPHFSLKLDEKIKGNEKHVRRKSNKMPRMRQSEVIQGRHKIHPFKGNSALPMP